RTDHRSPRASHRTCSLRARRRRAVEVVCQPELDVLLPQVTRRFASCQSTAALLTLSSRATSAARSRGTPTLRTLSHAVIPSDERSEESRDPYPCERSLMLSSRATSAARSRGTPTLRTLSHAVIPSDERSEESREPYPANALSRCHPERRGRRGDRGVEGPLLCERSLTLSSRATSAARSRGTTTLRMLSHAVIPSDERSEE